MTNQPMQANPQRIITGEVRFSFVHLLNPKENQFGGDARYSVTILVPKTDFATKQQIDAAIEAATVYGVSSKWNGVRPPLVATPLHDGDGVRPSDGMPFGDECKGHWVFTASSPLNERPEVVDANLNTILDPSEIYSGMYGRIAIQFAPYFQAGKRGVGAYISKNVQKTRDGEPLSGSVQSASDDFGGGGGQAPQQPAYQQPAYGQPMPQYQAPPVQQPQYNQQPAQPSYPQQPAYGQPAPQYQAPPVQQQPQQFDPITGAPINGGVMGI